MTLPFFLVIVADRRSHNLSLADIEVARAMVKGGGPNTLSEGEAVEIPCAPPGDGGPTAETLRAAFSTKKIDAIFVKCRGRRKAVLVADMDGTIVENETLDDLAELAGCGERVRELTRESMAGEMSFSDALRARVALLEGQPAALLDAAFEGVALTHGATTLVQTMRAHGAQSALISGGFTFFTSRIAAKCGFDTHYGNELEVHKGRLTGKVKAPILGPEQKRIHLEQLAQARGVKLSAALATGDGANDLPMLRAAGLGVAFHAKPRVRAEIERQINFSSLRTLLFAQGYPAHTFIES